MTSTRPYLIRAFYDWIVDNNCTPHIVVNASYENVTVPLEFVENGQIVLNVSISAVQGLVLGDSAIEFRARFGGKICTVYAPIGSILAIYARENGRGMVFAEEEEPIEDESSSIESSTEEADNSTNSTRSDASRSSRGAAATSAVAGVGRTTRGNTRKPTYSKKGPAALSPVPSVSPVPSIPVPDDSSAPSDSNSSNTVTGSNHQNKDRKKTSEEGKSENGNGDDDGGKGKGKGGRGHLTLVK